MHAIPTRIDANVVSLGANLERCRPQFRVKRAKGDAKCVTVAHRHAKSGGLCANVAPEVRNAGTFDQETTTPHPGSDTLKLARGVQRRRPSDLRLPPAHHRPRRAVVAGLGVPHRCRALRLRRAPRRGVAEGSTSPWFRARSCSRGSAASAGPLVRSSTVRKSAGRRASTTSRRPVPG